MNSSGKSACWADGLSAEAFFQHGERGAQAERVAALLSAEWRATEATITELEAELPYPLTRVAEDIRSALACKSFHARITGHLPAEGPVPA